MEKVAKIGRKVKAIALRFCPFQKWKVAKNGRKVKAIALFFASFKIEESG
jgi:hypothetical protein